ncbi:lipid A biosynthesis lauroyl acyltransferase [Isoalcanivorax pacificus W11-5]|uniref:Lipid A biosynthesis lauroyl acyltransferase n=1 Tax=Isoalcanivorax pacificus W11-5 TaxID=391936 RepID=A0A0B4XIJ0_9GAMM|nr:lysophospholipid acyltransferase family protein [Isoalcanivorax pacificus]AJD46881.1 lipid A biosynthesis lauroyl acyltransferase [Isoalcanivorax pacificus W11-5]
MHFNTIGIGTRLLSEGACFSVVYRPNDSTVLELIRYLRNGDMCWYTLDQDYGTQQAVFAPFFGVPAFTVTTTTRIARISRATITPISHYRLLGGRYRITFDPPLADFLSGDDPADATRGNQAVGTAVLLAPEQYLWMHQRFKHQADGSMPYPSES